MFESEAEDSNLSTSCPRFIVGGLGGRCGNASHGLKLVRHPGNAPGSPAWHTGILLLNQYRKDWYGLMVMLHRLLFVRQARYYYAKPA